MWADRLPDNAPLVDDGSTLQNAQALCSDQVNWIDLSQVLQGDNVFYRTDHHWSTFGAYQAYTALMTAINGLLYPAGYPAYPGIGFLLWHHLVLRWSGLGQARRDLHLGTGGRPDREYHRDPLSQRFPRGGLPL